MTWTPPRSASPLGQVPYTAHRFLAGDPRLVKLALATPVPGQRVVAGRILTGDQFITAADAARRKRLRSLQGTAVEMVGAARAGGHREPRAIRDHPLGVRPRRRRSARRLRHLAAPRRRQLLHRLHRHPARPDHPPAPPSWVSAAEREPATRSAPRPIPLCHRRSRDQQRRNYGSIGLPASFSLRLLTSSVNSGTI